MIKGLNEHLGLELAANIRYAGHASILRYHGYHKLAAKYQEEAAEEREHADRVIHRIQQLGGMPNYTGVALPAKPIKSWDVSALLETDLGVERDVLNSLAGLVAAAEADDDWETGAVLRTLVSQTEDHITWLTAQLGQIHDMGKASYLQAQL